MATSAAPESIQWTVVIMVVEDESLNKMYRMTPCTKLSDLMNIWKSEFELCGHWIFASFNDENVYDNDWMSIEMVGETILNSRFVTLKAELDELKPRPVSEIYVHVNDACHHLFVMPHEKLYRALWRLLGRPQDAFQFNSIPLNFRDTIEHAGLKNNSVIYPSLCQVTVKLSSGYSRILEMPSESLVLKVVENVNLYETSDFSLSYQGRLLNAYERIKDLRQGIVEVSTVKFVVHMNDRCVTWKTKSEPIPFSDFVAQLSIKGEFEKEKVEKMEYQCVGCRRCIRNSENVQLLPINCCKERSLTLYAMTASCKRSRSTTNDMVKYIQCFYEQEVESRTTDSRSPVSRCERRTMKERLEQEELDYNLVIECSEKLKKKFNELEDKIRTLRSEIQSLKTANVESIIEIQALKINNREAVGKIQMLTNENARLKEEIAKSPQIIKRLNEMQRNFEEESDKMMKTDLDSARKFQILTNEDTRLTEKDTRSARDMHITRLNKEKQALGRLEGATAGTGLSRIPVERLGVELLVFYHSGWFTPVSRPEIQYMGRYLWHRPPSYIKCRIPGISSGMIPFEAVADVLRPLITGHRKIRTILQQRATVNGREVAWVTSWEEDKLEEDWKQWQFCDVFGDQYSRKQTEETLRWPSIGAEDSFVICKGRRTILEISY